MLAAQLNNSFVNEYRKLKINIDHYSIELEKKKRELMIISIEMMSREKKIEQLILDLEENLNNPANIKKSIKQFKKESKNKEQLWLRHKSYIESLYPRFFKNLQKHYPSLSPKDQKLFAFIKMNLSNGEIAAILNITPAAISQSMRRLKKKIGLLPNENLRTFAHSIEAHKGN